MPAHNTRTVNNPASLTQICKVVKQLDHYLDHPADLYQVLTTIEKTVAESPEIAANKTLQRWLKQTYRRSASKELTNLNNFLTFDNAKQANQILRIHQQHYETPNDTTPRPQLTNQIADLHHSAPTHRNHHMKSVYDLTLTTVISNHLHETQPTPESQ